MTSAPRRWEPYAKPTGCAVLEQRRAYFRRPLQYASCAVKMTLEDIKVFGARRSTCLQVGMEKDQLLTLAETFDESINSQRSFSIEDRESWLKGLSEFAEIIMEAAEVLNKRDAALDRISELAASSYEQLAAQDKVAGAGRVLRSIMDIAAAAKLCDDANQRPKQTVSVPDEVPGTRSLCVSA